MTAALVPERDFRGPGCSADCVVVRAIVPGRFGRSEILIHSPEAHEEFGRITSSPLGGGYVWTGALVVDRLRRTATVAGREIALTPREWGILEHLAANLGRVCSAAEISDAVWGAEWFCDKHLLRVNMVRVRQKLGVCADLIKTDSQRGYRLLVVPPVESEPAPIQLSAPRPWAKAWDRCRACGRTDRAHAARGFCTTCRNLDVRGQLS